MFDTWCYCVRTDRNIENRGPPRRAHRLCDYRVSDISLPIWSEQENNRTALRTLRSLISLTWLFITSMVFFSTATGLEEERLLNYLASSAAHPLARPVKNVKDAVPVNLRIYLRSLDLVRLIYLSFNPKLAVNLK